MHGRVLVVSPHLDDAILSASAQLSRARVQVVTVCAGIPPADTPPGTWDVLTRARSAAERVEERLREDLVAFSHFDCAVERLDELDDQHRGHALDTESVTGRLAPFVAAAGEMWLPVGIGRHPDHVAVREAALAAHRLTGAGERAVHFYADVPYAIPYGWGPVPGASSRGPDTVDVEGWRQGQLKRCGVAAAHLGPPEWQELTPDTGARKRRALHAYRTQIEALGLDRILRCDPDSLLTYELSWRLVV
jgi:LmbE family N-acetylglucosaminyl deacetylase